MRSLCVRMGATSDASTTEVEATKAEVRDMLIRAAGAFRSSDVSYTTVVGKKAKRVLDDAKAGISDAAGLAILARLRMWLDLHPKGVLIIASCELREGAEVA